MRNTQEVISFIKKWSNKELPSKQMLFDYKKICTNLLYEDEDLVRDTIKLLILNIHLWAQEKSPIFSYLERKEFAEKADLINKDKWYVEEINSCPMATSGSTTGYSFSYRRWEDFLHFIECDNHYDLILDEFNIKEQPNILFFFDLKLPIKEVIEVRSDSKNFMEHHGRKRNGTIHYTNFEAFRQNSDAFFHYLVNHIKNNKIDVTFTTGPNLSALCNYLQRKNLNVKISTLLSNTNEKLMAKTIKYVKDNNLFDSICDHMRCWDGGATFFTCKEENYHLMDNISWCVEKDNKLISTDYFSLASPFVNYWNGDLCKIDNKNYQRCDCGRLYREFEFLDNRPFLIKGKSILKVREKLSFFKEIKEVRCSGNYLEIVSSSQLNSDDQKTIIDNINNLLNYGEKNEIDLIKISFLVENYGKNKG